MTTAIIPNDSKRDFILGGNAIVTFKSLKTNKHYTYKIKKAKNIDIYFVSVLFNADSKQYQYIGCINSKKQFISTKNSKVSINAISFRAFNWSWNNLNADEMEIWHEGRCGRCGRSLTDPESIRLGFGPICKNIH